MAYKTTYVRPTFYLLLLQQRFLKFEYKQDFFSF